VRTEPCELKKFGRCTYLGMKDLQDDDTSLNVGESTLLRESTKESNQEKEKKEHLKMVSQPVLTISNTKS